jgi:death-on-curing family protein
VTSSRISVLEGAFVARKRQSVRELAIEVGLNVDEALLKLWEAGVNTVASPSDHLTGERLQSAKQVLGIPTRREITCQEYWQHTLDVTPDELSSLLAGLGTPIRPGTSRLPTGAVAKLKTELRRRAKPPTPERQPAGTPKPQPTQRLDARQLSQEPHWLLVGHERELRMLSYDEVLGIHNALVHDFAERDDPISPAGVRSESLLGSAISRPHTSLSGNRKYPTVEMAAAALVHALVHNHPFHNGNKRTSLVAMLVFLDENALMLTCDEDELFEFVLKVAKHCITEPCVKHRADHEVLAMAQWIHGHSRFVEKGEHAIPFRELRRILTTFGCTVDRPIAGNRIGIARSVEGRHWLPWRGHRALRTQVFYGDEGREVDKSCIKKIRSELHLDDAHNVDSKAFYGSAPVAPEGFITDYRKTLQRLARL